MLSPAQKMLAIGSGYLGGAEAAVFASYLSPAGYHWEFVTYQGARVTYLGVPIVALVGN